MSGYRFAGLDGLVAHTALIADPAWRAELSPPRRRARRFGWDAFVGRLREEVDTTVASPSSPSG